MTPPRRKRRSQRTELRTVLLVTNGRVTENAYLQQLCRRVDRDRVSAKVKVINGDPLTVVKELSGPRSDLSDYREVWIVVDHDGRFRAGESDALAVGQGEAEGEGHGGSHPERR